MDEKEHKAFNLLSKIVGLDGKPRFEILSPEEQGALRQRVQYIRNVAAAKKAYLDECEKYLSTFKVKPQEDIEALAYLDFLKNHKEYDYGA